MAYVSNKILDQARNYGNKTASAAQSAIVNGTASMNSALAAANRAVGGYGGLTSSSYTTGGSTSTTTSTSKTTYDKYREYQRSQRVNQAEQALKDHLAKQPGSYVQGQNVTDARKALDDWLASRPGGYVQGQDVTQARKALDDWLASRPGAYESRYQGQIDDLLGQILNRPDFSYDFNQDAMYHQYRDQFEQQGKQAMRDTSAYNAAALTGGYGSSYAATAGAQAYQKNLNKVNDIIPELYQRALDRYNAEGDTLRANLGALQTEEERAYGQYRDTVGDWQSQRDYLQGEYWNRQNFDYGKYRDTVSDWQSQRDYLQGEYWNERSFDYGKYRDEVSDWQSMRDFLADQYGDEYARDFEAWAKDIELGGTTTTNTSRTDTSSWSNTYNYSYGGGSRSSGSGSKASTIALGSGSGSKSGSGSSGSKVLVPKEVQVLHDIGLSDKEIADEINRRYSPGEDSPYGYKLYNNIQLPNYVPKWRK